MQQFASVFCVIPVQKWWWGTNWWMFGAAAAVDSASVSSSIMYHLSNCLIMLVFLLSVLCWIVWLFVIFTSCSTVLVSLTFCTFATMICSTYHRRGVMPMWTLNFLLNYKHVQCSPWPLFTEIIRLWGAFKKFCKSICYIEKIFNIYTWIKCIFLSKTYKLKADVTSL